MTTQGDQALARAYEEEKKVDPFFQEKCDYHDSLMNKYFFNEGWTFQNCYTDDVKEQFGILAPFKYKKEVQKIFDKIGKMMERKFPK